jgi:hypothetical protein
MADRADWDTATCAQRHQAVAADAELRRRHPDRQYPPLRSAEPAPSTQTQRDDLTPTTGEQIQETGQWIKDLAAQRGAFARKLADPQSLSTPAEDPTTATSARPSRPGQHHPRAPSSNLPSLRSSPPGSCSSGSLTAMSTWKLGINGACSCQPPASSHMRCADAAGGSAAARKVLERCGVTGDVLLADQQADAA